MKDQRTKLVAPDGGWGWMVCLGNSFVTFSLRSLDPSFGLLFGDLLKKLEVDTVGASVIMSILDSVMNFSGLFVGPLIKKFSYRKVAIFGSLLSCTGLILTSQANSVPYIICTYSILGGLGTGFATTSSFVALNNFFKKKRTQVVGLSMAGTTLGMMLMPQIVNLLLMVYDFRGAVLILGALALHAVVGSSLFQPVAWHMVPESSDEKEERSVSSGEKIENQSLLKMDNDNVDSEVKRRNSRTSSTKSEKTTETYADRDENDNNGKKTGNTLLKKIVSFFDLKLLKDPIYLNILLGLSLFYAAELNFKVIMPFFLSNIGMTKSEVAYCLSFTAFADIVARLTMPTIFTKFKLKNRHVFWASSLLAGISRSITAQLMPGKMLMLLLMFNGFFRGVTMTNLNLTVAEHCSVTLLPSAMGMLMVSKGLAVAILGPLVGYIRDASGSYPACIHTMTSFIVMCSLLWGIEKILQKSRSLGSMPGVRKDNEIV